MTKLRDVTERRRNHLLPFVGDSCERYSTFLSGTPRAGRIGSAVYVAKPSVGFRVRFTLYTYNTFQYNPETV